MLIWDHTLRTTGLAVVRRRQTGSVCWEDEEGVAGERSLSHPKVWSALILGLNLRDRSRDECGKENKKCKLVS